MIKSRPVIDKLRSYLWIIIPIAVLLIYWLRDLLPPAGVIVLDVIVSTVAYGICLMIIKNSIQEIERLRSDPDARHNTRAMIIGLGTAAVALSLCLVLFPVILLTSAKVLTIIAAVCLAFVIGGLLLHSFCVIGNSRRLIAETQARLDARRNAGGTRS